MPVNAEKNSYKTAISDFWNFENFGNFLDFFSTFFYFFKKSPQISTFSKNRNICRVRAGKRTQAVRVRSSCFGCLATLQKRHLESKGSCLFAGTAGGSWVRCGFCCLFERPKRVFSHIFSSFWVQEKVWPSSWSGNRVFIFFPIKKQGEICWVCQAPIVMRRLWRQLSAHFVCTVCIGHEYAAPCSIRIRSGLSAGIRRGTHQPILGVGQQVDETQGHRAVHLGQPRRASLFLGTEGAVMECHGPGDVCSATAGPSTLVRAFFSGCSNKGDNGLNTFHE